MTASRILRERLALDAFDAVFPEALRFPLFRSTDRPMDVYLRDFGAPRNKAEERMVTGGGFPEEFVAILNNINRRTGERNRCVTCNSEYHFAPQRSQEESRGGRSNPSTGVEKALRPHLRLNRHGVADYCAA